MKKLLTIMLLLSTLVLFTACSSLSPEAMITQSITATQDITSYELEADMNMNMVIAMLGEEKEFVTVTKMQGYINKEAQAFDITTTTSLELGTEQPMTSEMQTILKENTMYIGGEGMWMKQAFTVDMWSEFDSTEEAIRFMENVDLASGDFNMKTTAEGYQFTFTDVDYSDALPAETKAAMEVYSDMTMDLTVVLDKKDFYVKETTTVIDLGSAEEGVDTAASISLHTVITPVPTRAIVVPEAALEASDMSAILG